MTLSEIREAAKVAYNTPITRDETSTVWDLYPRCPYKDLPSSLQKTIRDRFTTKSLFDFLHECYVPQDFESTIQDLDKDAAKELLPFPQDSYISFETITEDIPPDDLEKILIRTRNTATYTIKYESHPFFKENPSTDLVELEEQQEELVPVLYGDHAKEAFARVVDEYRKHQEEKQEKQKELEDYEKEKAEAKKNKTPLPPKPQTHRVQRAGNLISAGYYQYIISDKKFQNAMTTQENDYAYIAYLDTDAINHLNFKDGKITYDEKNTGFVKRYSKGKYTDVQDLDFPLLQQIYTAAVKCSIRNDAFTITVSLPQFFREMGIEVSKGNAPDIMRKLHSFENCVGIMPETQTISKLFSIINLDMKNQTMTFAVPYFMQLLSVLMGNNHIEKKTRKGELIDYIQPCHNALVHSSIVNERNKTAVELVYLITTGLLQRGYKPDIQTYRRKGAKTMYPERVTYSISFRSLINNAPLLRGRIWSYKDVSNRNNALRRAFEKAYQLIDTKTDAAEWFVDLHDNRIIPTMATLDDELTFTHNGKNGDYKRKK